MNDAPSLNDPQIDGSPPDPTPFMSFSEKDFYETASWARLAHILTRNGGAYGLYGPRGSGKTWLMRKAIGHEIGKGGMGLWFPCPSEYDTMAFLSSLSDNLASAVEQRFVPDNVWSHAARRSQPVLIFVVLLPLVTAIVTYAIHGLNAKGSVQSTIFSAIPSWLWLVVAIAILLLLVVFVARVAWDSRPEGRLVRVATGLRERIRYTTALTIGTELDLSGGGGVVGAIKRSQQRSLNERPATVASLLFDFRNLAELIVATTSGKLVIGIDELDKVNDPDAVRNLLRDVKGVFEITNAYFLVSVSEEAAAALQLGSLRTGGRNEFNSSFYTVIELPPLSAAETVELLGRRGIEVTPRRAQLLCLLSAGNWRETVRLAEGTPRPPGPADIDRDSWLVMKTLEAESVTLLGELITYYSATGASDELIVNIWNSLPRAKFSSLNEFIELSGSAIRGFWRSGWSSPSAMEDRNRESWQRLLVRLFVAGVAVGPLTGPGSPREYSSQDLADLRDVLIVATHSSAVAYAMLTDRFGLQLDTPDLAPPPVGSR
jgi:hypothetical protein